MDDLTASRTAVATSLMRAAHTRLDPKPLIDDPWGDRLVPESLRSELRDRTLSRMDVHARQRAMASTDDIVDVHLLRSRAYPNVIMRTRYCEDALKAAVAAGIGQYVLIGAGFDSFILRRPAFATHLQVFEIDHPATQGLKVGRIKALGVELPSSVHFIAADLGAESLQSALARSAFDTEVLTFFSWLGVTMYLTREANFATLHSIAAAAPPGSELVFTYIDEITFASQADSFVALRSAVAALGEPFLSGFDPAALAHDLERCGLTVVEDLTGDQAAARYGRTGSQRLGEPSSSHIALARVAGR